MDRGQGNIQQKIIVALSAKPQSVDEIALGIYGAALPKYHAGIRQALQRLAKAGFVKQSGLFTEKGERCWILEGAQMRNPQDSRHLRRVK
jgi:hypothetical protein